MSPKNNPTVLAIPIILGMIAFFIVVGPKALNPLNIDWLLRGESLEDYLAWVFYRRSPWSWPIGINPNYGLEISSSIVYSDSIPLLAIFFKIFRSVISETFQYFGIWLLTCFILQGIAAWMLIKLITNNYLVLILGTTLFIFSPTMLWRIDELQGALVGHFFILFAIYLNLRPDEKFRVILWCLLLCASVLVHFYIFAMVFILWVANFSDLFLIEKKLNFYRLVKELFVIAIFFTLTVWQSGYFLISGGSASEWGYGQFNFNLLSIFYSRGWSNLVLIKDFIKDFESFNYVGLGILLLFFVSTSLAIFKKSIIKSSFFKKHIFYFSALVCLMIFAISNSIDFGPWSFVIPIPDSVLSVLNVIRHSNRFFWPVYYSALLFSIYCLVKIDNRKILYIFLIGICSLQIYDTQAGWGKLRHKLMWPGPPEDGEPLQNSFWNDAAKKYKKVIRVPISHKPPQWGIWARYASEYQLATNSASFARVDRDRLRSSNEKYLENLITGKFDSDTLYVIDEWKNFPINIQLDPKKDLLARVDGFNILAPGWKSCIECNQSVSSMEILRLAPPAEISSDVYFSRFGAGRTYFLLSGWSWPGEDWGTWSDQGNAKILLPLPMRGNPSSIQFNLRAFVTSAHPTQSFKIVINGIPASSYTLSKSDGNIITVPIPKSELSKPMLEIDFIFSDAASPTDLGLGNGDTRKLAIGLKSLRFE